MKLLAENVRFSVWRQVFAAWSIHIPMSFEETFVDEDRYWHAWDDHRSVSLTSVVVTEDGAPVEAVRIAREFTGLGGSPVDEVPPGVVGQAAIVEAEQPARASRALAGVLAATGRVLLVTITADDLEWARWTWLSIRAHPAPLAPWTGNRASRRHPRAH